MKERIIVTLTTYSKRINNIPTVLDTIFNQTLPPDLVVLNLAYEEIIPDVIQDYINQHGIEIYRVADTKVYKKLIPTLKRYPNDCIISIDDDWLYPDGMIEDFMHLHGLYPEFPISGNNVVLYGFQCHCGCASLMKFDYLGKYIDNIDDEVMKSCPSDDLVYTYFSNKNNHPYLRTKELYSSNMQSFNEGDSYSTTMGGGKGIIDTYDYLVKRFGNLDMDIIMSYLPKADAYIVSIVNHVYQNGLGSEIFLRGYYQGISEMKSSYPFRVGKLLMSPITFFRNFFDLFCGRNE